MGIRRVGFCFIRTTQRNVCPVGKPLAFLRTVMPQSSHLTALSNTLKLFHLPSLAADNVTSFRLGIHAANPGLGALSPPFPDSKTIRYTA